MRRFKGLLFGLLFSFIVAGNAYGQNLTVYGTGKALPFLSWRVTKHISTAFTGGTPNDHGDHDGTGDPYTIFTVTGAVLIHKSIGVVGTDLVGAATLDIGTASDVDILSPTIFADTSTWDVDEIWDGESGDATAGALLLSGGKDAIGVVINGEDVIETLAAANVTAGQIDYYIIWTPLEGGALVR